MALELSNSRIKLSSGRLFWREVGQGSILVFLHGSWTDGSQWVEVLTRLGQDHHCCAVDLLGFGESEQPDTHYSIDLETECLGQYLDALKFKQVYLIGHSLGAWIATNYALKEPDRVRGLVLIAPEGVPLPNQKRWGWESLLISKPAILYWGLRILSPLAWLVGMRGKIRQSLELRQRLLQFPVACQLLFQRRRNEIQAEFLQERLSWLTVPSLILQAEPDPTPGGLLAKTYAQLIPKTQVRSLPPGSLDLPVDYPDAIAQYIREFVAEQE